MYVLASHPQVTYYLPYNKAIATSDTEIILNSVIALLATQLDGWIFAVLKAINSAWTENAEHKEMERKMDKLKKKLKEETTLQKEGKDAK
jgi:hypothetical protein